MCVCESISVYVCVYSLYYDLSIYLSMCVRVRVYAFNNSHHGVCMVNNYH